MEWNRNSSLFEFESVARIKSSLIQGFLDGDFFLEQLKATYDCIKSVEEELVSKQLGGSSSRSLVGRALSELLISGFDEEQVWQQLELQNADKLGTFKKFLTRSSRTNRPRILMKNTREDPPSSSKELTPDESLLEADLPYRRKEEISENHDSSYSDDDLNVSSDVPRRQEVTEVDDQFFSLRDMEEYLSREDQKEMNKDSAVEGDPAEENEDDDNVDHFETDDIDADAGKDGMLFSDFFDPPSRLESAQGNNIAFDPQMENMSDHTDEGVLSSSSKARSRLEEREDKLKEAITAMEEENLAPKTWQMAGEISGETRPENALLEEHLAYENATKLPPEITQDTTEKLEQMIKQRIKDNAWDDVERKVKPVMEPYKYRNELVLDQEKPKISLGEVYEQEFLKQSQKEQLVASNPRHVEIKKTMKELFDKLNALTNYHYTPTTVAPEIRIVSNMRSLNVEDVAPVTASTASLLAPEEVKPAEVSDLKGSSEKDQADRNRDRRRRKDLKKRKLLRKQKSESNNLVPKDKLKALEKVGRVRKIKVSQQSKQKTKTSIDFFGEMQKRSNHPEKITTGAKYKL